MTVIVAVIVQRTLKKTIVRFCDRAGLSRHVRGILILISNVVVAVLGIFVILGVLGLPVELFALTGALTGTAIGFASTQTLGNFLAGLYILITSPFKVMDYIKIGDIEGEVRRITINYTRIFTPTYNLMEIPNREILNSRILNCTVGDQVDYTFTIGFDHKVGNKELVEKCIIPAIHEFHLKHKDEIPKKPEHCMASNDRLGREFAIRFFFPKGRAKTFYDLQPELVDMMVRRWDTLHLT